MTSTPHADQLTYPYPLEGLSDPNAELSKLRDADESGQRPPLTVFYGHRGAVGTVGPWVLSQWFPAAFTVEGLTYPDTETFMMASKARLFADRATWEAILNVGGNPKAVKALGREVRGFDQAVWDDHCYRFVVAGNVAKFGQNRHLRRYLAQTAPTTLVEASPWDRIWGIGRGPSDPRAQRPGQWAGRNLLGFALTDVRTLLAASASASR